MNLPVESGIIDVKYSLKLLADDGRSDKGADRVKGTYPCEVSGSIVLSDHGTACDSGASYY